MAQQPTITTVPRTYTAAQAMADSGANLRFIVEKSPKSKAGKTAADEISRRYAKRHPEAAAVSGDPAEALAELGARVDEAIAEVTAEVTAAPAPVVLDKAKAERRVIEDLAHTEAGDGDGHLKRYFPIRARMIAEHAAGKLTLNETDVMVAALEAAAKAQARAQLAAERKAAKAQAKASK